MAKRKSSQESVCQECGKVFVDNRTVEEKLLDAIFGKQLCTECRIKEYPAITCAGCGKMLVEDNEIYYEGKPYHPECLPGA